MPHSGNDPRESGVLLDGTLTDPLIVELLPSGDNAQPIVPEWAGQAWTIDWPLNGPPTASLPLVLRRGAMIYTGARSASGGAADADLDERLLRPIEDVLTDDTLVRIRTARQDASTDGVLFEGFADQIEIAGGSNGYSGRAACRHLSVMIAEDEARTLQGQLQLSRASKQSLAADPTAAVHPSHYSGLECVFNPFGNANCRTKLVGMVDADDVTLNVPVFTFGYDAEAQPWTWARVLLYLLYWARRTPHRSNTAPLEDDAPGAWTITGGNWTRPIRAINLTQQLVRWMNVDPNAGAQTSDAWGRVLMGRPKSHVVEGLEWERALLWTCQRAGIAYNWESGREPNTGELYWGLRFSVPGYTASARKARLYLPSPNYRTDNKTWEAVRSVANVTNFSVQRDKRGITNAVSEIGAARRYEVTIELVPGWTAHADWDIAPTTPAQPDVDAAINAALARVGTAEWHERFTLSKMTDRPSYSAVGRLWGANTYGAWSGYGRGYGPFGAAQYALLDLGALRLGELANGTLDGQGQPMFSGSWAAARPRVFGPCLSGASPRDPWPPHCEISFDAGATWRMMPGAPEFSRTDLRVRLSVDDLLTLTDPASGKSYAEQFIRGRVRLRVTATIEGDSAVRLDQAASSASLSRRRRGKLLLRREELRNELREDRGLLAGGNSQYRQQYRENRPPPLTALPGVPYRERFDDAAEYDALYSYVERGDRMLNRGQVELPEIVVYRELSIETPRGRTTQTLGYRPGDQVEGIIAEDGQHRFDIPLRARQPVNATHEDALVSNVRWSFDAGDPLGQRSPQSQTVLSLEDRAAVRTGGG